MKLLAAMPCCYGAAYTDQAIHSIVNQLGVDVLIVENGAIPAVRDVVRAHAARSNITVQNNPVNIYVNPVWNQIIRYFTAGSWDYLCITSADVVLQRQWSDVLRNIFAATPNVSCLPKLVHDVELDVDAYIAEPQTVYGGTPGVFITLNRRQIELVYPLPECCKLWWGDCWIYTILRATGHPTIIPPNLLARHYGSQDVARTPDLQAILDADQAAWDSEANPRMLEIIARNTPAP